LRLDRFANHVSSRAENVFVVLQDLKKGSLMKNMILISTKLMVLAVLMGGIAQAKDLGAVKSSFAPMNVLAKKAILAAINNDALADASSSSKESASSHFLYKPAGPSGKKEIFNIANVDALSLFEFVEVAMEKNKPNVASALLQVLDYPERYIHQLNKFLYVALSKCTNYSDAEENGFEGLVNLLVMQGAQARGMKTPVHLKARK
jgi:hypothetical protein